jgi:hypothetical protein
MTPVSTSPRSTISVTEFRRAVRAGGGGLQPILDLFAEIPDSADRVATVRTLLGELPKDARWMLVTAAGHLDDPVDDILLRALRDRHQTQTVRSDAAGALAHRGTDGWEEHVAAELVARGRNDTRYVAMATLMRHGTGTEWRTALSYLRDDLRRPHRVFSDPSVVETCCVYILRGMPPTHLEELATVLLDHRGAWDGDEREWLEQVWPGLFTTPPRILDWDTTQVMNWRPRWERT